MAFWLSHSLFLTSLLTRLPHDIAASCTFPSFLHNGDTPKIWVTQVRYHRKAEAWETYKEITVTRSSMNVSSKVHSRCPDGGTCYQGKPEAPKYCHRKDGRNHYIIRQRQHDSETYICVEFVARSSNIVQLWESDPDAEDGPALCTREDPRRNDWPWIDQGQMHPRVCPLVGGYDFRAQEGARKDLCVEIWKTSHVDAHCMPGDGLHFIFPAAKCNIFTEEYDGGSKEQSLYCYGHWSEDKYHFYILGRPDSSFPQFVMRLPNDPELSISRFAKGQPFMLNDFHAMLYFNPVAPASSDRGAPGNVYFARLNMHRSDPSICYDESDRCSRFTSGPGCMGANMQASVHDCRRTCNLCNLFPNARVTCHFPKDTRGHWMSFAEGSASEVKVRTGQFIIPGSGTAVCKSRHWAEYKLLTYFNNGCRSRYTCLELEDTVPNLLRYRTARGSWVEKSFEMCEFTPSPLFPDGVPIQTLYARNKVQTSSCGLHGSVQVTIQKGTRQRCMGYMSDWDHRGCRRRDTLTLILPRCSLFSHQQQDFKCIAYIKLGSQRSALLTRPGTASAPYTCWAVSTSSESPDKWSEVHLLNSRECGLHRHYKGTSEPRLKIYRGKRPDKSCGQLPSFIKPMEEPTERTLQIRRSPNTPAANVKDGTRCISLSSTLLVCVILTYVMMTSS